MFTDGGLRDEAMASVGLAVFAADLVSNEWHLVRLACQYQFLQEGCDSLAAEALALDAATQWLSNNYL